MENEELVAGSAFQRTKATLRLRGANLDPDVVTRLLACEPTGAYRKGDPLRGGRIAPFGLWRLSSNLDAAATVEQHVRWLLSVAGATPELWSQELANFSSDIFVGAWLESWNTVFGLQAEILADLGARGIALNFDLYVTDDDE